MFTNNKTAKAVRLALIAGAATTAMAAPAAFAAEEEDKVKEVERVQVTGSRIRKIDFASNAPVATLGEDQFDLTATINTESLLNSMPQVVPGLDRTSNNPGNGTATVDLRGLGTNRTLVLINGKRATPTTQSGVVDINTIPTALIKSVEVLTGGASAVYGSDAVAGVVNFILKDDFEGVQFDAGYETTEEGDATFYNSSLTLGGNFADGKGNVVFNYTYTDREELFQGDRDFSTFAQFDDTDANGNPILIDGGSSGIPATSIFAGGLGTFSPDSFGVTFGQDGSVRQFETGETNDFYNYAPVNYIQLPQKRHQFTSMGHYEFMEGHEVFGRTMFTSSNVPQQLAPTPIFQTSTFTLDGSPFLTAEAQQILSDAIGDEADTDGDGIADTATALVRRRLEEVGPRVSQDAFSAWQYQFGIRGEIGDTNWTYDGYYQEGVVSNSSTQLGNVNRDRFDQALLLDLEADPTGGTCQDTSNAGSTIGCAPINIFGEGNISADGAAFLNTAVAASAEFEQRTGGINVVGDSDGWLELPGGAVGISFGIEHIENVFDFRPSQDLAAGTIAGFNGAAPSGGSFKVDSYFGELYLPILDGAPFAELLEVELAYRTSHYDTAGTIESYKVAGAWAPNEMVRFRAGFNTAVRAPNIGELFSPANEGFPGATDPCSALGEDQSAAVAAICASTGVPANVLFTPAVNLPAGQARSIGGGNPNLVEEQADTLTIGVVVTPTDDLSISFDYFDIEIEDAISTFGGGTANILNTCYDPSNPAGGAGSVFCDVVNRRADGTIDFVETGLQNVATETLTGYDLIVGYNTDFMDGTLSIDYLGTYTEERNTTPFAGGDVIECAGNFGQICGEPIPEYKHRATVKYANDDFTAQVVWRYVGEVNDDDNETEYFVEKIDAESYINASGTYYISDNYNITAGVRNLFDNNPPIMGDNQQQANTFPSTYDVFGRTYYVNFSAQF